MSAGILDGKALAGRIKEELRCKCGRLARAPRLAVVLVGDDPASAIYVRNKERDCRECGIDCRDHRLAADTTQEALLALIRALNRDDSVDGILVQLPLPGHLDGAQVLRTIDPDKDVDAFHPENVGRLLLGQPRYLPCMLFSRASSAWRMASFTAEITRSWSISTSSGSTASG